MKRNLLIFCTSAHLLICTSITAQTASPDVVASAGDHFTSPSGSVSWTIGEPVTDTYYGATNILTKGFHQPVTISLTSIADEDFGEFLQAYPNPVINDLVLDFSKMEKGNYTVAIYDVTGRIVQQKAVEINNNLQKEIFDMSGFGTGAYFVRITNALSETYNFFRVIKQ